MTKTMEEAANEYADNAYYPAPDYGWYESDDEQMKECLADTFKAGANYVYGLPIASRMTAEEKETFREMYGEFRRKWWETKDKYEESDAIGNIEMMETIFGEDFLRREN